MIIFAKVRINKLYMFPMKGGKHSLIRVKEPAITTNRPGLFLNATNYSNRDLTK
jgi:hypothetical protein